jgi:DegV family protein with EDD domain
MRIVVDSCCELTDEMKQNELIQSVPLKINVGGVEYVDDASLNVDDLLLAIDQNEDVAKTSCPSPEDFYNAMDNEEDAFVVTLTGTLSGTYNSARLAVEMLKEKYDKKVHIFNTNAASIKETLVTRFINQLIAEKKSFDEIVEKTNEYMDQMKFFFHLDVLDTLVKNGRMSKIQGKIANLLNIKLIMTATENGEIDVYEKTRTSKKAMRRLVDIIGEVGEKFDQKILGISYCDCYDKANALKEEILKKYPFKDVILLKMGGLSSTYSNRGGIILSF